MLLIGAGQAGVLVAREIANRRTSGSSRSASSTTTRARSARSIGGLAGARRDQRRRRDRRAQAGQARTDHDRERAGREIRRITELCRDAGLETKIIPGIYEIVGDKVNLSRIREVAIEDLLGREPVQLDEDVVGASIRSRVVLVTGAGGSIGSELCRQMCRFGPERLVLVEQFENALFEIHRELASAFPQVPSDNTSLLTWLTCQCGIAALHGPMIEGLLAEGPERYDEATFLALLQGRGAGLELRPGGMAVLQPGEATGPLYGGTLTQLVASLGTPYAFAPPEGCILFIEDVNERPYRIDRMLTQLLLAGVLRRARGLVFGEMRGCDEPTGPPTAVEAIRAFTADFPGPVLFGFHQDTSAAAAGLCLSESM